MKDAIEKVSLNNLVYEKMLNNIVTGVWEKGTQLPNEFQLAKLYNVSRVPIREAVQKLKIMGLVDVIQGKGTFVKELDANSFMTAMIPLLGLDNKNIIHMLEYRYLVEPACVKKAIELASDDDISKIGKYAIRYDDMENPKEDFRYYDMNFHQTIIAASQNTIIIALNNIIKELTEKYLEDSVRTLDIKKAIDYHAKIFEAIKMRDGDKAASLMQLHIEDVKEKYINRG